MIEKYYKLDVEHFYRDFKANEIMLAELLEEKQGAACVGSMDYSSPRVDGGTTGDFTASRAEKRMSLDRKIKDLREYFEMEQAIYDQLPDEDRQLADALKLRHSFNHMESELFMSRGQLKRRLAELRERVRKLASWV